MAMPSIHPYYHDKKLATISSYLALNHIQGIGFKTVQKIFKQKKISHISEIFTLAYQDLAVIFPQPKLCDAVINFNWRLIEPELKWLDNSSKNHHILLFFSEDNNYPELLREIHSPPLLLFLKGNIGCLASPKIAIVGTRYPTPEGYNNARYFAEKLANYNFTIVSGLAAGIDHAAHQGSLLAAGQTIAILGNGLNYIYPRSHRELSEKIIEAGVLISEFPLNTPPIASHFPQRNRLISGLSLGLLVVEATENSGSLITARFALEQNREVFAIPGSILNPATRGCHRLIQSGALLTETPEDILRELNYLDKPTVAHTHKIQPQLNINNKNNYNNLQLPPVSPEKQSILNLLYNTNAPLPFNIIATKTNLETKLLTIILSELELDDLIINTQGCYLKK